MNEEMILSFGLGGLIFISSMIIWICYGYPIYALLKCEKIELKKKQIELEILKNKKLNKGFGE